MIGEILTTVSCTVVILVYGITPKSILMATSIASTCITMPFLMLVRDPLLGYKEFD